MIHTPFHILVLNPGSTSTKVAWFADETPGPSAVLRHTAGELSEFPAVWDQFEFRSRAVGEWLEATPGAPPDAVAAIGGLFRPVEGGTYSVNDRMLADARGNLQGEHASNLGCALAKVVAAQYGCPAYVVDPVSVDELDALARYSGSPLIERRSLSHALNIHAVARKATADLGLGPAAARMVVAHLGGGISIAAVRGGRIVDVNDAASDGPFSPERTGGLPLQPFISLAMSGRYREDDLRRFVMGRGGWVAYLGTNVAADVEQRIKGGDDGAREILEATAYQIAKEIGAMATVHAGSVDAIILTGGLAAYDRLVDLLLARISFLAPVLRIPGENEMAALAHGALRALRGEEPAKEY
jgi:butyrate kinase